ncbi:sensor histidine kinase [Nocardia sp. NPDC055165]
MLKPRLGVRGRILAIALVPSAVLLGVGATTAGSMMINGYRSERWASGMLDGIDPMSEMVAAFQQERQATLWLYAGAETDRGVLTTARTRVDAARQRIAPTENVAQVQGSEQLRSNIGDHSALIQQLFRVRSGVDSGTLSMVDAYAFYGVVPQLIILGTSVIQDEAPSTATASELAVAVEVLSAVESLSRATALGAVLARERELPESLATEYVRLIGYYHTTVENLTKDHDAGRADAVKRLMEGSAWVDVTAMEAALTRRAVVPNGPRTPLPLGTEEWQSAVDSVSRSLLGQWDVHNRTAQSIAVTAAKETRRDSVMAGVTVLVLAVGAFLVALWMANRIIRRLTRLRDQAMLLADEQLPEMMRRLQADEPVDPKTHAHLDFGSDEIGQVAKAFDHAHTVAVGAAIAEARTREGVKSVFLNIAHRSQLVVHRQLEILDEAQARQENPALLDIFFRLDHLATRERRHAENLTVLAGGKPGRQWRQPVPLIEVVRSGVGEAVDYTRVRISTLPDVSVAGIMVADLVHLIAELVDNAASFSPPTSHVDIRGGVVGRGLAIEIIDQGIGIPATERVRLNELLEKPPGFGVSALAEGSRLGLFVVARLAARHGITVRLTDSDYGGIRTIVLVPADPNAQGQVAVHVLEGVDRR